MRSLVFTGILTVVGSFVLSAQHLYPIQKDNLYGFIDNSGKVVIEPKFEKGYDFAEQYGRIKQNGKYGYIDHKGKIVIEPQFDEARDFREEMACVKKEGQWFYIDRTGKTVITLKDADYAYSFREGVARYHHIEKENKLDDYGYVDHTGKVIIPPNYHLAYDFHDGLARVSSDGKSWGFIDKTGKLVIEENLMLALTSGKAWQTSV